MTYKQLAAFDAGIKFSEKFKGEKIPLLEEVLDMTNGKCTLLIEIKNPENSYNGIEQRVADMVIKYNAKSWCVIQSFEYETLQRFHKINPDLTLGFLIENPLQKQIVNKNTDISYISEINISQRYASIKNIEFIHRLKKKVFVWTVNKPERMKQLIKNGVDGIITDDPKTLQALISN